MPRQLMAQNQKGRYYALVLAFFYMYLELSVLVNGKVYPSIQWSSQNPRFKEGTFRLNVLPNSKISIICPHVATSLATTDDRLSNNELFENFWIVDNSSYSSCNVNRSIANNQILLSCSDPTSLQFETLVFLPFSPNKALEFVPGRTYYFISTSTGLKSSLMSDSKGHCETANMKMKIYICTGSQDVHCSKSKPTTPAIGEDDGIKIMTTASTATIKDTTQITSTHQPLATQEGTTQPPMEPDVGQLKKEKEESPAISAAVWIVIIALLGAMLAVSVGINFYYLRKYQNRRQKTPDYNRGDSLSPPLMANHV